jgi:hypothetical protein
MPALPPSSRRGRPRRGSLERPLSGRLYRGTWLLVGLPLLIAAFTTIRPAPLPPPPLQAAFSRGLAVQLAVQLAQRYPSRAPGSRGDFLAARWLEQQLGVYEIRSRRDRFTGEIPGRGKVPLENVIAVARGRLPDAIVLMAHRDNNGTGPGANDNASGTAALIELARVYTLGKSERRLSPHTVVFLSTDAGTAGLLGAQRFAETYDGPIAAVVNLDGIGGSGRPRVVITGDAPRSPPAALVATAAARILDETGSSPEHARALSQLVDLGFPFSLFEQAPLVGRGIPAVTITTLPERPPSTVLDSTDRLSGARFAELGRAAEDILGSLDQGPELNPVSASYLYLGTRAVRGWAVELVLIAMLLPYALVTVDLFARCRRRRIPLAPALRSYRSRLWLWLWTAGLFELFAVLGVWPGGEAAPVNPASPAADNWPVLGLVGLAVLSALGWAVARDRLVPRREVTAEDELASHTAGLLMLGAVALLVVATNPFALIFVLPSLHAWLWLPQVQTARPLARFGVLAAGFLGPVLLLGSFAFRLGLGLDAPWYLLELTAVHYVTLVPVLVAVGWLAAAHMLTALALGRYAPYPARSERPPRGPIRNAVRAVVLASRSRRRARQAEEAPVQSEA